MSLWRQIARGTRVLTNRAASDRDVSDEVQHYLEQMTAEFVARGMSVEEARHAAQLALGNSTIVREEVRAYGWENAIGTLLADLRYAGRRLRSNPGFASVAVLTLALGIGATTAIFSAVNPILFAALPYPNSDRIVVVWDRGRDGSLIDVAFGTYREVVSRARGLDAIAVMKPWQPIMTTTTEPERFDGQRVSASYFRVLGVIPALGRDFESADDRFRGPNVVIMSDGLWRRRFGADRAIIGRQITLNDNPFTVIGVMPAGFESVLSPAAQIWAPLQYDASLPVDGREWGHHLRMIARLGSRMSLDQAERELGVIARRPVDQFQRVQWASLDNGFIVARLQDDVTRAAKPALLAVLGAVMLVLVIACVNVTNLLLARAAQRRGEFAMRIALGAGRSRLIRQLLTESLLLAIIGGTVGLLVAQVGVRALVALSPPELPRVGAIRVDGAVFAFALGISAMIGLAVGLMPALHATRTDLRTGLQRGSRSTVGSHRNTRGVLVVAEVALALVLLVSAGLLLRSLERLFAVSPGFEPSKLLTMQVQTSGRRFESAGSVDQFFTQVREAVSRVPGVRSAAFTSQLPLSGDFDKYGVQQESGPALKPDEDASAFRYAVTPGYFETIGIPLRLGRSFDARDNLEAPLVAIVNESFAKRRFPGLNPIGQRVHIGDTSRPWYTIVGVVGNVRQTSLAADIADAAYVSTAQWVDTRLWLVVRAHRDAASLAGSVRKAIWSVDKDQPVVRVATMEGLVAASAAERRFALIVFEGFALVALMLAATGIYGVLSGGVAERIREIGVRSALGASPRDILRLVVGQGMMLTSLGVAIGLGGAMLASRAIITLLFGVSRLDPITYVGVIVLLFIVSGVSCLIPASRAAQVDPSITLRAD